MTKYPPQSRIGPSWNDVRDLQGAIQSSYGGFCVIHMASVPTAFGPPKSCWWAKWGPALPHAHLSHYRGVSWFWPDREFRTVPEMLLHMLQTLDRSLGHDEEQRRIFRQPPLRHIILPDFRSKDGIVTTIT